MDLQELGYGGMDWIDLARDREVAGSSKCGKEHSVSIKSGEFLDLLKNRLASPEGL
jgi:hypothetical protein